MSFGAMPAAFSAAITSETDLELAASASSAVLALLTTPVVRTAMSGGAVRFASPTTVMVAAAAAGPATANVAARAAANTTAARVATRGMETVRGGA